MRKPREENKHNIKIKDIRKFKVIDREKLKEKPFWRNDVIGAYCLSGNTCKNSKDYEYGTYSSYWIGFYDEDAKAYKGKTRVELTCYGDICVIIR